MARLRHILLASDFSKASSKAFAGAIDLAKANHAALTILHVVESLAPVAPEQFANADLWDRLERESRAVAKKRLDTLVARATKAGVRAAGLLLDGTPAQRIVDAARTKRPDLVVVGTHGRTGFARFFVGSVAGRVVATSPCAVMTIRGK